MSSEFEEQDRTQGDAVGRRDLTAESADGPLWITVASRAGVTTLPLPAKGRLLVGRSSECEVHIDEPSISRRHLAIYAGTTIEVEDLGSRNGTRVRDTLLAPHTRTAIGVGDVVSFGANVMMLQGAPTERPRRILAHGYFEMYLEGECARAHAGGPSFAVARVRVEAVRPEVIEYLLAVTLSPIDQFAMYAPGEYEILMLQRSEAAARQRLAELSSQLGALGHEVRSGLAVYPVHGRTPEEIIAAAAPVDPDRPLADGAPMHTTSLERLQPIVRRIAAGHINVLILGETGVGKEVMADTIHRLSPRAGHQLLSLNCAALSESLLESELFGYERGAFTGAVNQKPGLLETASGGTVFLDEIGEMPASIQAKLLRVIEQKQVMRLGALKPRPIDVRFVAATHRDLENEVARGRFRQDLFFRLNGFSMVIPPLRERVDEIDALAKIFVESASKQLGLASPPRIHRDTLQLLRAYSWPGNIRELRNVMERAVLLSSNGVITAADVPSEKMGRVLPKWPAGVSSSSIQLPPGKRPPPPRPEASAGASDAGGETAAHSLLDPAEGWLERDDPTAVGADESELAAAPDEERRKIVEALERCAGNQTAAAKLLGISRRTLVYRLTELNLPRPRRR